MKYCKYYLYFAIVCFGFSLIGSEVKLKIDVNPKMVKSYERVDFLIQYNGAFSNPYNPDEVDLSIEIKNPGGTTSKIPAFYIQPYERRVIKQDSRALDWIYPKNSAGWQARFTPREPGKYLCVPVLIKNRMKPLRFDAIGFEAFPSKSRGFVRVSEKNRSFFSFDDGSIFFPIGQNLAFIGSGQYANLAKAEEIFQNLMANGANYLRIWACCDDWAMAIESPKSAFGRSWGPKPNLVPQPDNQNKLCLEFAPGEESTISVSPSHPLALRPETRYLISGRLRSENTVNVSIERNNSMQPVNLLTQQGWSKFQQEFTTKPNEWWLGNLRFKKKGAGKVWLADISLMEVGSNVELLWEADVNRPRMGVYNQVDSFMLDEVVSFAEKNGVYLQICLLTRNLYMHKLEDEKSPEYDDAIRYAKQFFRYAVARWGYSTSVASWEYWNEQDPNLPTDRFYSEFGEYLEQIDTYKHLRATSAWGPALKDWRHSKLDVSDLHWYLRPVWGELWKNAVAAAYDRAIFLRKNATNKPALLSEFGLADDKWGLSPYMKKDKELLHFHDALWSSSLSGLSGTTMFWWWEQLDAMNCYNHYKPLSLFLSDVPFVSGLHTARTDVSDSKVMVIGLQGRDCAYLFLSDIDAIWYKVVVDGIKPEEKTDVSISVKGLVPGEYRVQWWDTYKGNIIEEKIYNPTQQNLTISVPSFRRDIAGKIVKAK